MLPQDIKCALLTHPDIITRLGSLVAVILQLLLCEIELLGTAQTAGFQTWFYRQHLAPKMETQGMWT